MIKKPKPKRSKTMEIVSPAFIEKRLIKRLIIKKRLSKSSFFENWGSLSHLRFSLLIFALLELLNEKFIRFLSSSFSEIKNSFLSFLKHIRGIYNRMMRHK